MSSLSRERRARRCLQLTVPTGLAVLASAAAGAAEIYYQPVVQLSTSYNTNVDLDTKGARGAEGYFADAATTIGIATPRSESTLQPRLLYNYFPTVTDRNRLEGFLNANTRYSWERDRFNLVGFFDHRDDVNAEQPTATQNTLNPGVDNTSPTTGQIQTGVVRNYLILDPTYSHLLTPLSSIGLGGEYQGMRYSPDDQGAHVSFNYYRGRVFYAKTVDLRTNFSVGFFGDRYQSLSTDSHSTSGGVQLEGGYNWTQTLHSNLTVGVQRTKFDETSPRVVSDTSNPWSATLNTVYKQQVSSYSFSIGRSVDPNGGGGLFATDQVRGQYDRDFTPRLHFTGAVRAFRSRTTAGILSTNTRNYATGLVSLKYMMSRTLFISGSYSHVYQKYHADINSAEANVVYFSIGYSGLQRQR
jgi:hypothetical protein